MSQKSIHTEREDGKVPFTATEMPVYIRRPRTGPRQGAPARTFARFFSIESAALRELKGFDSGQILLLSIPAAMSNRTAGGSDPPQHIFIGG